MSEPRHKRGTSKQDYATPKDFLAALKSGLGIDDFSFDLAASAKNTVAKKFYSEEDNALVQPWDATGWQYLNPPYSNIEPWVEKAYYESLINDARIVMLIPASVGSNWWRNWVHNEARVWFLNRRLKFGGANDVSPKDHAVLIYAPWIDAGYFIWDWKLEDTRLADSL